MKKLSWMVLSLFAAACAPSASTEMTNGSNGESGAAEWDTTSDSNEELGSDESGLGQASASAAATCSVTLVEGKSTLVPTATLPRPALNVPYTEEHYKLKVTRVTDPSQVTDHDIPTRVRHEYSRRPAFNADSTRVLEDSSNGWFRLYQVNTNGTFTFLKTINLGDNQEPNWSPTDPNKIYFFEGYGQGLTISTYNIATDQKAVMRDLGSRVKALFPNATGMWTKGEGRPSNDGKVWCVEVGHTVQPGSNFVADGLVSYNLVTDTVLGHMKVTESPDHISTSPKGDYCIPSWGLPLGTRAYKADFSSYTQLEDRSEHSDLAVTKSGDQVYVYSAYDGVDAGKVMMVRLADGQKTPLFDLYGTNHSSVALHVSGTSRNKPGYVTVSLEGCDENYGAVSCNPATQWFSEKIVAVELAANPRIYNLAHIHRGDSGYFGEATAVANPDLTKVLFASSWGSTDENKVHDYLIQVPSCALP
jgi:hypothetical protein